MIRRLLPILGVDAGFRSDRGEALGNGFDGTPDRRVPIVSSDSSSAEEREEARLRELVERGKHAERVLEAVTFKAFQELRGGTAPPAPHEITDPSPLDESLFRAFQAWQDRPSRGSPVATIFPSVRSHQSMTTVWFQWPNGWSQKPPTPESARHQPEHERIALEPRGRPVRGGGARGVRSGTRPRHPPARALPPRRSPVAQRKRRRGAGRQIEARR